VVTPLGDNRGVTGEDLKARLAEVFWLGGGSGAGKSTMARLLAADQGMRVYDSDEAMSRHAGRLTAQEAPELARFKAMTMDERWCLRTPEVMLETFHWFRGEGFHLIVEDLVRMPAGPIVVEGFRLLPDLVRPLAAAGHAHWLLPTPAFRRAALTSRGTLWDIARQTSDPERALANLLERDRLFTERLSQEIEELGLPGISVESGTGPDVLLPRVRAALGIID
jgi:hypothetical protein